MNKNKLPFFYLTLLSLTILLSNTKTFSQASDYNDVFPSWSPDGKKIVFQSDRDGDEEIYIMNINGSEPKRLTSAPGRDAHPNFSPDGKTIVFQSNRMKEDAHIVELYTMNPNGSDQKQITHLNKL